MLKYILLTVGLVGFLLVTVKTGYSCGARNVKILGLNKINDYKYLEYRMVQDMSPREAFECGQDLKDDNIEVSTCAKTVFYFDHIVWRRNNFPKRYVIIQKSLDIYSSKIVVVESATYELNFAKYVQQGDAPELASPAR